MTLDLHVCVLDAVTSHRDELLAQYRHYRETHVSDTLTHPISWHAPRVALTEALATFSDFPDLYAYLVAFHQDTLELIPDITFDQFNFSPFYAYLNQEDVRVFTEQIVKTLYIIEQTLEAHVRLLRQADYSQCPFAYDMTQSSVAHFSHLEQKWSRVKDQFDQLLNTVDFAHQTVVVIASK